MTDVYRAIADGTRRALLDELLERDEQTLFELCSRLAMKHDLTPTRQAVSQHLDILEAAGLVREGYQLRELDAHGWKDARAFHEDVKRVFSFPAHYTNNLASLVDALSELEIPPGGAMAVQQAVGAFELFTGRAADADRMHRHFRELTA